MTSLDASPATATSLIEVTGGPVPEDRSCTKFDVLVCAGTADLGGLMRISLRLLHRHFDPLGHIHIVTPRPEVVRRLLDAFPDLHSERTFVWSDSEICPEAIDLPPWFRQQYIKLHADRLAPTKTIVCLGADTLILDPIGVDDLVDTDGRHLLRYFRYRHPNPALRN